MSLDTETTGLRPFHGDRLFSVIIAESAEKAYYFNFNPSYPDIDPMYILAPLHLERLKKLFSDPNKVWFIHKFNYDAHVLTQEMIELAGTIHCTVAQGRVEYNDHLSYSLDACLDRIDLKKDDKVKEWILANDAWDWENIPGKKQRKKNLHYERVPLDLIVPYGEMDAKGCFALGMHQIESVEKQALEFPSDAPNPIAIVGIERRLAKTVLRMENRGVLIDRGYCERAIQFESNRATAAAEAFQRETGEAYQASSKLFERVFGCERANWAYTEKGNPSFESDVLGTFKHPGAKLVQEIRDAKAKCDFYHGFLYQADSRGYIHPNFNPGGTATGRFSSSEPNLQNLTSEDEEELKQEFVVRRAIIPRPGYVFLCADYRAMEYCVMLDYSKKMYLRAYRASEDFFEVVNKVRDGFDVHQATADLMTKKIGKEVTRRQAKTLNFLLLYAGGAGKLADALKISLEEAKKLKSEYFSALPYVQHMMESISNTIQQRGWVRNWAGRKYTFKDRNFAYKGPNYIIQGGCADIMKIGLNRIDELLLGKKSKLVLTIHDEVVIDMPKDELYLAKEIVAILESVYPAEHIPLKCSTYIGEKSLADLESFDANIQ